MSYEYFISKKTLKSVVQGKKVSKPIVRISIISIALAVIVNLITIAVVTGFQQEVRQKVSGFGSHIFIMGASEGSIYESEPIRKDQSFIQSTKNQKGVKTIFPVGYKPVLFQSKKNEIKYTLPTGKDTSEIQQNIYGTVLKGVNDEYDWSFFKKNMVEGKIPVFGDSISNKILISRKLSDNLNFTVGDTVNAYFVRNQPVINQFIVSGIYETGLEELDKKIVMSDLRSVQKLNDWGILITPELDDTLGVDGNITVRLNISGGNGSYLCNWGGIGFSGTTAISLWPYKDTTYRIIATDYWGGVNTSLEESAIPDTAYIKVTIEGDPLGECDFDMDENGELKRTYLNQTGSRFSLKASSKTVTFEMIEGNGSSHNYVGGFEINVKNWDDLDAVIQSIEKKVEFIPTPHNEMLQVTSIKDNQREIFVWLGFLDINVIIILSLMIIIGVINMGSALLVLILIRSNFIGMMKSMGATNWKIRKIFLIQAGFLIGRGMLIGNVIGLGICFAQSQFGIIQLNPDVYYLNQVPIELNVWHWLILNIATLLVCLVSLILPSVVITRINPVKAIKLD
ncbi:MAG: FtsX-like permease family protein [Crocinitomicaceae bacterium]|nr:FtsX-like permease family protein [Crocinitomicaceae bacterium]